MQAIDELGPLPIEHHREKAIRNAQMHYEALIDNLQTAYQLTNTELFYIITKYQSDILRQLIAIERRTNTNN